MIPLCSGIGFPERKEKGKLRNYPYLRALFGNPSRFSAETIKKENAEKTDSPESRFLKKTNKRLN